MINNKRKILVFCFASSFFLLGCQSLFFWPSQQLVDSPSKFKFDRQIVIFNSIDDTQLHGWFLPAKKSKKTLQTKGTIYFLHGNAQNLSYHIANLYWLTDFGWNVFVMDYRGYGRSHGEPDLKSIIDDAAAGYYWLKNNKESEDNIIILGQSLGGAVAVSMFGLYRDISAKGLIVDSAFSSHRTIFREILGRSPIFWTFQYPLSLSITDDYAPERFVGDIQHTPILFVHSDGDQVIDKQHSIIMYNLAKVKKALWLAKGIKHIGIWEEAEWQKKLVCQLNQWPNLQDDQNVCAKVNNVVNTRNTPLSWELSNE